MSETTCTVPQLKTRKPTGKPPWPMILLAGVEKSGKSYSAAAFSASDLIDRMFWIEIGEGSADQYGALPGARYEIVEHDGTYRGIGNSIWAATQQPRENGKPHAITIDSMTELWDLLSDEAQAEANARYRRKFPNKPQDTEAQITMDLWNVAKKRWRAIVDMLRTYDGPVILTSRLEQVAVIENGKPTEAKTLKVRAEKNLPFEVDAIVQIPAPRVYQLTGVRSVRWTIEPGGWMDVPDFTVDGLLRNLGLDEVGATLPRSYTAPRPAPTELTVEQAVGQMRRHQADEQSPEDDPWASEPGPPPSQDDAPKPSTHGQRTKLVLLVRDKRGITGDDGRHALASELLGHEVGSFKLLTFTEAHQLISLLEAEPDHIADAELVPEKPIGTEPNPRNGDAGQPLDPALFVPSLQSLLASARGEGAVSVADSLAGLIGKASTPSVLERLFLVAMEALSGEHITAEDFARINAAGQAKDRELTPAATPPQSDAPGDLQYEAADGLAKRIRQTHKLDALNALHGTLTEARDGNRITAIQFATLERQMDERYQVLAKAAGMLPDQAGEGWSHRKLAQSGASL